MRELGSWAVEYQDGTYLSQYDQASPHYFAPGGEVPVRCIEWTRVRALTLESQWAKATYEVTQPPEGYRLSLRMRHVEQKNQDDSTAHTMAMMLVVSAGTDPCCNENTAAVLYWLPNGQEHHCHRFDCPDVSAAMQAMCKGSPQHLAGSHELAHVSVDAVLVGADS